MLVVDTPSGDGMETECRRKGFYYLASSYNNRAGRLNDGVNATTTDWLIFHHPRSLLPKGAIETILNFKEPCWGGFTHSFDRNHPLLAFTSWWSNHIRGNLRSIYYLDHCLFSHRSLLTDHPPFGSKDIFEDTEFCLKLRKKMKGKRIKKFAVITSSIRFQKNGLYQQALLNQYLKARYFLSADSQEMNIDYEENLNLNQDYRSK
ncbi:MAG: glycosyl transferase, family 2 [Bdellovibrionales bacterium CG12_big_fil_rev_8_21_14_0_65_38_15]|nr:MAG: glycosyl transferase, family 2 [Bdellovibrionales bacterium CG12_big_fil_rev_8_21_14_0_65_38_15]PIR31028.1 MAG: glycosyl transferase, family 2 [Bdellovibrionales bacterium CG11_big_fil_rev_8_21_14_0_20_38_13]